MLTDDPDPLPFLLVDSAIYEAIVPKLNLYPHRKNSLQKKVKEVKQERNDFSSDFLSPVQQMSLDRILSPPAPSIQHFGFHDRMKCMVCKDPAGLAVPPGSPVPTLKQK